MTWTKCLQSRTGELISNLCLCGRNCFCELVIEENGEIDGVSWSRLTDKNISRGSWGGYHIYSLSVAFAQHTVLLDIRTRIYLMSLIKRIQCTNISPLDPFINIIFSL